MSIQQLAIFGDKLVVRQGKLRQRSRVHVLCSVTMASYGVSIYTVILNRQRVHMGQLLWKYGQLELQQVKDRKLHVIVTFSLYYLKCDNNINELVVK